MFFLRKTNGVSKYRWLHLHIIVRAGLVFGHHLNEGLLCLGCWRNPSVLCLLLHIPSRQRTCCCEGTFLHWTWVSWGSPYCQAPSSSDKGHDTALLTFSFQAPEKQKGLSPWRTAPWRAPEMLAFPVAYNLCHSNYIGLYFDFLPLSQPSRR